jgi:hypothetical protein
LYIFETLFQRQRGKKKYLEQLTDINGEQEELLSEEENEHENYPDPITIEEMTYIFYCKLGKNE